MGVRVKMVRHRIRAGFFFFFGYSRPAICMYIFFLAGKGKQKTYHGL